jgi:hypothetical protein
MAKESNLSKLNAFIASLEPLNNGLNNSRDNKILSDLIIILQKKAENPVVRAQIEDDENFDNRLSGYLISLVTLIPDITQHPHNQALKNFGNSLDTTDITHYTHDFILDEFLETVENENIQTLKNYPKKTI